MPVRRACLLHHKRPTTRSVSSTSLHYDLEKTTRTHLSRRKFDIGIAQRPNCMVYPRRVTIGENTIQISWDDDTVQKKNARKVHPFWRARRASLLR